MCKFAILTLLKIVARCWSYRVHALCMTKSSRWAVKNSCKTAQTWSMSCYCVETDEAVPGHGDIIILGIWRYNGCVLSA